MSCTNTCVWVDIDGAPEFYSTSKRRAAKPHVCEECRREIVAGENYERIAGKWDGEFQTFATCAECCEIRKAFYCDGFMIGMVWEDIRDQLFPRWRRDDVCMIDCLARLTTVAATEMLLAKYADYLEDYAV